LYFKEIGLVPTILETSHGIIIENFHCFP